MFGLLPIHDAAVLCGPNKRLKTQTNLIYHTSRVTQQTTPPFSFLQQHSHSVELSTEYAIVSKAAVATTTSAPPTVSPIRSFKGRIQTTTPRNLSSKRSGRPLAPSVADASQQDLLALSSKSYISGPTTQPSKLTKRAGLPAQKKYAKDVRNRSSVAVERNRLQHDVVNS